MSFSTLNLRSVFLGSLVALAMTGCGAGKKVVTGVSFTNEVVGGDLYAGMDATLAPGGIVLPGMKFPLINPRNPAQVLGELETNGLHIIVRVNATAALKIPDLGDGTRLPNGNGIPLVLPAGMKPIGIPVMNSNSMVYLAISGQQILVGAAISIAKADGLNLPLSLFLPFDISSEISGTAGFFLGDKQGVAVFALREPKAAPTIPTVAPKAFASASSDAPLSLTSAMAAARGASPESFGRIEVRQDEIKLSTVRKFEKALKNLGDVKLD